jgi:GxxExxY protein
MAYKGVRLDCGYRLDILVEDKFIVEVKAVERLLPIHQAQVLTYLKLTGLPVALLVNFNVAVLKYGLRRLTRKPDPTFLSSRLPVP